MILHPGILALLLGALLSLVMLAAGAFIGLQIARNWHPERADETQLALERRSWLAASLVQWAVGFEAVSLLLFIFTAEDLHPLFAGAMCATGTLNANPTGWHLLWIKLLLFVCGSLWCVTNRLDQQSPVAPLTRPKYLFLWLLLPLCLADLIVMVHYFTGLEPEIITSCCGSLFSSGGQGIATELAALPIRPTILIFYGTAGLYAGAILLCRRQQQWIFRTLLAVISVGFFAVNLASTVAFISIYFYQLPTHHCPFDLLQSRYHFIGYPLYGLMFGTLLCGLVPQQFALLQTASLLPKQQLAASERSWLTAGIYLLAALVLLVSWPLVFGEFSMRRYF